MNIGEFYGYSVYRQNQEERSRVGSNPEAECTPLMSSIHLKEHLTLLQRHEKEVQCHYSIACSQLEELLHSSSNNSSGSFFGSSTRNGTRGEERKVQKIYQQQCMKLQLQHNFAQRAIRHIITLLNLPQYLDVSQDKESNLRGASHDSLRVVSQCLLDTLLAMMMTKPQDGLLPKVSNSPEPQIWSTCVSQSICETLFRNLCVNGTPELRVRTGAFLLQTCSSKLWWGDFLVQMLQEFFSVSQDIVFPKERQVNFAERSKEDIKAQRWRGEGYFGVKRIRMHIRKYRRIS